MITQFSQFHLDKLTSMGAKKDDLLRAILCHSHDEEENEDLLVWDFLTDADLSSIDGNRLYNFNSENITNH